MNVASSLLASVVASAVIGAHAAPLRMPKHLPCEPQAGLTVLDFSLPVPPLFKKTDHSSVMETLRKEFKVDTIIRYYDDREKPTFPGKTLRADESDALIAAGFKIGVVFQHNNGSVRKFSLPNIGKKDAELALSLADENKQPYKTAIYFGVDGPFDLASAQKKALRAKVHDYFQQISTAFAKYSEDHGGNGYYVGLYCSVDMCDMAKDLGLNYVWLSPAERESPTYRATYKRLLDSPKALNLVQYPETKCRDWGGGPLMLKRETGKMESETPAFDFNQVNSEKTDLGTWDHKRQ